MTRELKFKGWHVTNKKMFSPEEMARDQLTLLPTGEFINVHGSHTHLSTIFPRDKFIPLQFTGLKDRNGKEIYEGDIIKNRRGTIYTVEWKQDSAAWNIDEWEARESEAIGNIFDNKELFNDKSK